MELCFLEILPMLIRLTLGRGTYSSASRSNSVEKVSLLPCLFTAPLFASVKYRYMTVRVNKEIFYKTQRSIYCPKSIPFPLPPHLTIHTYIRYSRTLFAHLSEFDPFYFNFALNLLYLLFSSTLKKNLAFRFHFFPLNDNADGRPLSQGGLLFSRMKYF